MLTLRKAEERGHANHGWLNSYHTFSFANYYDPNHMGFRKLRVINDDRVQGGMGFGAHGHRDMEIITYVVSGELAHKDSMGNSSVIQRGEIQIMSAGTGIVHSEFNNSPTETSHFMQIWISPNQVGLPPRYDQKLFTDEEKRGQLCLLVSPDGRNGSMIIHQDVDLYASLLSTGQQVEHILKPNRHAWIQVIKGEVAVNGQLLTTGDAVALSEADKLVLEGKEDAELLLFDLA